MVVIIYPYFATDERWDLFTDFLLRGKSTRGGEGGGHVHKKRRWNGAKSDIYALEIIPCFSPKTIFLHSSGTDYFAEHSLTVAEDLGVDKPFIACYHPHAIVSFGMLFNAGLRKDFTGLKVCTGHKTKGVKGILLVFSICVLTFFCNICLVKR